MKHFCKYIACLALTTVAVACTDDDSFSTSQSNLLTFATDTVSMDTVFSRIPTSRKYFWVYNRSGDGIRCTNVRLENGNQSGFRVNVDGTYLSSESGYQTSDVEIRNKDSIFVNVELTTPVNNKLGPQYVEDNLVFRLESGVEQKVNLNAYSWDANIVRNLTITSDTTISSIEKPTVVFGTLRIDSAATVTIEPGSTLYFHSGAGIDVYGKLVSEGTAGSNITMRTDRTDHMFDYLPYDMMSGQWNGIRFRESSYDNSINFTDIHGTFDGIVCDSSDVSKMKLAMLNSTVHNCQGYGLKSVNSVVDVENCQISNALNDCVAIYGGVAFLNHCTLAQFYPFDSNRGVALRYVNGNDGINYPLYQMDCINSIVTGYSDDEIMGQAVDTTVAYTYRFINSILRTDTVADQPDNIIDVMWEKTNTDSIPYGEKNFRLADIDRQYYDFHLDSISRAIGNASQRYALPYDRDGNLRDDKPDIGCYEFIEPKTDE